MTKKRIVYLQLCIECGGSFTGKLEGMFKDVNLSTDLTQNFRQSAGKKYAGYKHIYWNMLQNLSFKIGEIDFSVNVLTASHW